MAKGVAPVVVARVLDAPPLVVSCAATLAVVGHMYPVWLGFHGGGKGVATAAGALGALAPIPALISAGVFLVVASLSRYVSLGSVVAAAAAPAVTAVLAALGVVGWAAVAYTLATGLLIIGSHGDNLRRLRDGTERRLGERERVSSNGRG